MNVFPSLFIFGYPAICQYRITYWSNSISNNITVHMKTSSKQSEPNPFRLQKNNKNFFLQLSKAGTETAFEQIASDTLKLKLNRSASGQSRIKHLNEQIEQLAKRKEQMLFKDSQLDYIFKNQRPAIKLNDFVDEKDKKFRVRTILKGSEKRETLHEFLQKKKQIFLSKMNINIKKEETNKLEDYIRDEKATLRARQLYFKNDVEFMNKFITDIKTEADKAQGQAEAETKTQESLTAELTYLETEIERKENLISKAKDDFETLESYKHFLNKFLHFTNSTWKPYRKLQRRQTMFITEGQQKVVEEQPKLLILFSPDNLLDIFNQIEENNIGEIQNRHDTEAQLEKVKAIERQLLEKMAKAEAEYQERFRVLQKSVQEHSKTNHRLKEMKKNHRNKIKITDNEDLDLDKIGAKIVDIYKDINPKFKPQDGKGPDSKQLKKCMTEIQQQVIRLREQIAKQKQLNPSKNQQIEKQIKQTYKKQSLLRKQQQSKELQQKKQAEQSKKKSQAIQNIQKGRRDMAKVLLQKKAVKKKVEVVDDSNKDDKYFKADDESDRGQN